MNKQQQGAICATKCQTPTKEQAQCKEFLKGYEAVQRSREATIKEVKS